MLLLVFFIAVATAAAANWENRNYARSLDLARGYVRETVLVDAVNVGAVPQSAYYFAINDGFGAVPAVDLISAAAGSQVLEVEKLEHYYRIDFAVPIAPQSSVDFKVRYVYHSLAPYPPAANLSSAQSLLLKMNKYVYSPYNTSAYTLVFEGVSKGQEMTLVLDVPANATTENLPEAPGKIADGVLSYGPVLDVPPLAVKPMGMLYEHNRPLAHAHKLERSIWIPSSHVSQFQIEEYYELTNRAVELASGFSRLDWMAGNYETMRDHWGLSHLEIPMTYSDFDNFYYTDKVGMVSTHAKVANFLVLAPRYPLFGGWWYNFTIGWDEHLDNSVRKASDDLYIARVPLLNNIKDITYNEVSLNFYLPEGSELVNVSSPIDFESIEVTNEQSYFDVSKGHVKVALKFTDLFDDLAKLDVLVLYKNPKINYYLKIVKISGFVFVALVSYYALGLIDISIKN